VPGRALRAGPAHILELLSRNLEGEIGPELCAEMERHVAACGRCHDACESLKRTLALCRTARAPEVPVAVQEAVRGAVRRLVAADRHR
jgi:RNA polymerase sigma-70 factor (ECF subfamily)